MDSTKTIWMGNINNSMTEDTIRSLFRSISHNIKKIHISRKYNKKASAFIEFNSIKNAKYFIREYNNKTINGLYIYLNWAKINNFKPKTYTVRKHLKY